MFGKKKAKLPDAAAEAAAEVIADSSELPPQPEPGFDRSAGPYDVAELPSAEGHADFGSLLVPKIDGLQLRLEADPNTRQLVAMTLVRGTAMVQVRALAAPRSGGLWETNLPALLEQIQGAGGQAEQVEGPFGTEVHARLPVAQGEATMIQPMRYVGIDGPRWMLMGTFAGSGADPAAWDPINEVFQNLAVVRGEQALPVGTLLQLTPLQEVAPAEAAAAPAEETGEPPVTVESLQPGARITEVR